MKHAFNLQLEAAAGGAEAAGVETKLDHPLLRAGFLDGEEQA
jgi:hypothetical protein